ncbi:MAG: DUF3754 domain-containing protein [Isosphaeraceae bacterium]
MAEPSRPPGPPAGQAEAVHEPPPKPTIPLEDPSDDESLGSGEEGDGLDVGAAAPAEEEPERSLPVLDFNLPAADVRERAMPVRQGDLTRLLIAQPGLSADDRVQLGQFGRLLGAMFHSEFYERLRELKELYAPLDPDSDYIELGEHTAARTERSDEDFLARLESALVRANYRPLSLKVIESAVSAPNEMGLTYIPDFSLFEHLKVHVRGFTRLSRDFRAAATGFRKGVAELDAYQRMVVALKFKPGPEHGPLVRSDVVYLRMFKDVPHVDMEMHLPEQGTKVRMRLIDKAQIASPLFTGLPALVYKLFGAAAISTLGTAAMGSLILAPITIGVNSFFGFHRAKQKHLHSMIRRLYYLTIANNGSVLTRLIDSAEEEEYKEAMLAYFFLWRGEQDGQPWDIPRLDARIEAFLQAQTGLEINFEVSDALQKLFRLGLARHDHRGHLFAIPIEEALRALDRRWDETFRFA